MRRRTLFVFAMLALFVACNDTTRDEADAAGGDAMADAAADASGAESDVPSVEGQCVPYADNCPDGEYCQLVDGDLRCIPNGSVEPDPGGTNPLCPDGTCSRGGICMPDRSPFGGGDPRAICYQPCDPSQPDRQDQGCFNSRHTCWPAYDAEGAELGFGLCAY